MARRAAAASLRLRGLDADRVVAAAWLHDIGYAPTLRVSGFHPLDGAMHLTVLGWDDAVVRLVAHHSFARMSAPWYGVAAELAALATPDPLEHDVLAFADVTAGVDGFGAAPADRILEMRLRHAAEGPVPAAVRERRYRRLLQTADRVSRLVAGDAPAA